MATFQLLGSLENLQFLHFHNNRFLGKLPSSFQNLTNLITFDLAKNDIIPLWIGEKLSKLQFLTLESNKFYGEIPLPLCRLSNLQLLNLAQNNITGCIPPCFWQFYCYGPKSQSRGISRSKIVLQNFRKYF